MRSKRLTAYHDAERNGNENMELTRTSEPLCRTIGFNMERRSTPFVATADGYCTLVLFVGGSCHIAFRNAPDGDPDTYELQSPAILCLCAQDQVELTYEDADTYTMVFSPTFLNVNMSTEDHDPRRVMLAKKHDLFSLSPFLERHMSLKILPIEPDDIAFYLADCESILHALDLVEDTYWSCRVRAELMDILLGLEVQYENRTLPGYTDVNTFTVYRHMLVHLHNSVHNTGQIAQFCSRFGVNKNKLQVIFRTYTGRSYYGCVKFVKVEHAKRYLAFTALSYGEIARRLGFSSADHFYRFFAQETGETPHRYRSRMVEERKKDFDEYRKQSMSE